MQPSRFDAMVFGFDFQALCQAQDIIDRGFFRTQPQIVAQVIGVCWLAQKSQHRRKADERRRAGR